MFLGKGQQVGERGMGHGVLRVIFWMGRIPRARTLVCKGV